MKNSFLLKVYETSNNNIINCYISNKINETFKNLIMLSQLINYDINDCVDEDGVLSIIYNFRKNSKSFDITFYFNQFDYNNYKLYFINILILYDENGDTTYKWIDNEWINITDSKYYQDYYNEKDIIDAINNMQFYL